jgi:antitoxin MazE
MKARIVKIGNSQGIRIPKLFLEQTGLGDEVEIEIVDDQIVIKPATSPRQGWAELFKEMAQNGDDKLLIDEMGMTDWDKEEWEW